MFVLLFYLSVGNFLFAQLTPLHIAAHRGSHPLVEYLIKKFFSNFRSIRYLFHFCVFESCQDNTAIVEDKKQILKYLMTISHHWIEEKLQDNSTPLLQHGVHFELVEWLIQTGADVNVCDENESTVLHKLTFTSMTPESYHQFLLSLDAHNFQHFDKPNSMRITPLMWAIKYMELLPETLKFFHEKGSNFNTEDRDMPGNSVLFYAIRGGRSVDFIHSLIEHGADCNRILSGRTVLHACVKYAHIDALAYFLNAHQIDINVKDTTLGRTPLHIAIVNRSSINENMIQLLIENGADVNSENRECNTPFIEALTRCKGLSLKTIQLMEEHGLQITPRVASEGLSVLLVNINIHHWELDSEFSKLIEYLIQKGGFIDIECYDYLVKVDFDPGTKSAVLWSPWDLYTLQQNLPIIIKDTDVSPRLLDLAEVHELLTQEEIVSLKFHGRLLNMQVIFDSIVIKYFYS